MKVLMLPHISDFRKSESGIRRVVESYFRHLPEFGIELVGKNATTYDLKAVHAGMTGADCAICHCHGAYWTADLPCSKWEYKANAKIVEAIRHAKEVTVPSAWVAETFQRDMHFTPHVIPHGIEWQEWQHCYENEGFVLWNKNRPGDACSPEAVNALAQQFPSVRFVSTFALANAGDNVTTTGVVPHAEMKQLVQQAGIYLATTKETGGIGIMEAMASGTPVLGYKHGAILDLVEHGVTGYLVHPEDTDDLVQGLNYCLEHRAVLGANAREAAKRWTWEAACAKVAKVYELALRKERPTVAVVIPSFNYPKRVEYAVKSAMAQTYGLLTDIVVVDDGSTDDGATERVVKALVEQDDRVRYIRQENAGVAIARNAGIASVSTKFVSCLDADDQIEPNFLEVLVPALESDSSLGIAYSGLLICKGDNERVGGWPTQCNFDEQLKGIHHNQVPTCCVFRRKAWQRLGGYRQRYSPAGCGTEDAEFWLRIGSAGWGIRQITDEPLLRYYLGGRTNRDKHFEEVQFIDWHPYCQDGQHPFASIATPRFHSHPVRAYDEPLVSVIIPVGPGHEKDVINALDSLEAQTFRNWEAIVVNDTRNIGSFGKILRAFPFIRYIDTLPKNTGTDEAESKGAGYARNRGFELARAPFSLPLDADDWLYPQAIEKMFAAYSEQDQQVGIYSDYVNITVIDEELAKQAEYRDRLLDYNPETGDAVLYMRAADYDWQLAHRQPDVDKLYNWCNITMLMPTAWHHKVGGFDESMEALEDWDYYLRLSHLGKCFVHLHEPLLVYGFLRGNRREWARQNRDYLIQYLQNKYEGVKKVACKGCGQKRRPTRSVTRRPIETTGVKGMDDSDFVLVEYTSGNKGEHAIIGVAEFDQRIATNMVRRSANGGWLFRYGTAGGRGKGGDKFLVHKRDVELAPNLFRPVETMKQTVGKIAPLPQREAPPPPPQIVGPLPEEVSSTTAPSTTIVETTPSSPSLDEPEPFSDEWVGLKEEFTPPPFDPQLLPGVTPKVAEQMRADNIQSAQDVLAKGIEGLMEYKFVGQAKAEIIIAAVTEMMAEA
jgi:glycosyltransferase involved in cell wall biosynthesis